jgi:hypothetical protein
MSKSTRQGISPEPKVGSEQMERRRFLRTGALVGVGVGAAAGGASCATLGTVAQKLLKQQPLTDKEMDRYLAQMDLGLAEISSRPLMAELLPKVAQSKTLLASVAPQEALVRKSLRSLYFTAMHSGLPDKNRDHPGLRQRIERIGPEMDEAVFTMAGSLDALSDTELGDLQSYLKQKPDTGLQVCGLFEGGAKDIGLPFARRMQMRSMMSNLTHRLGAHPPSRLIDEYVSKVQKVASRNGQTEELKRYLTTAGSNATFWTQQQHLASLEKPPTGRGTDRSADRSAEKTPRKPLEAEKRRGRGPGQTTVNAGLILLGLTAASGAVGGIMMGTGSFMAGLVVFTAGAVLLIAGLVVLIVGAALNLERKPR